MTLERVAELVRVAAADTGVVTALRDDPQRLRSLLHLTSADLEALAATTTKPQPRARHADLATAATSNGTLLPPEGSGEGTGVALSGITSTTSPTPAAPPSEDIPPAPPTTPPGPKPPPTAIPPQPPPSWPPPWLPPQLPPTPPPQIEQPPPPPWPMPVFAPPGSGGGPCGCPGLAATAILSTLSTTAITAITAIAAISSNHGANRPGGGSNA